MVRLPCIFVGIIGRLQIRYWTRAPTPLLRIWTATPHCSALHSAVIMKYPEVVMELAPYSNLTQVGSFSFLFLESLAMATQL